MPLWVISALSPVRRAWRSLTPYGRQRVVYLLLVFLLIGVAAFAVDRLRHQRDEARSRARALALDLSNAAALLDTVRPLVGLSLRDSMALRLGDSVRVLTRLVVQRTQQRDAIDRALSQERMATLELRAAVASLDTVHVRSIDTVRVSLEGDRSAAFNVRRTPYSVYLGVTLPPAGAGRLDTLRVQLDTARITARLGCSTRPDHNGVHTAALALQGPSWLALASPLVEQDASVCGHMAPRAASRRWYVPTITLGYGATWSRGRVAHGPATVIGWSILR